MNWLPVQLLIAIFVAVAFGRRQSSLSAHFRVLKRAAVGESGGIVFPGADDQQCPKEVGSCVPMDQCANAFNGGNRKNFPPICKWEGSNAFVCCPPKEPVASIGTEPAEFPEADCAVPQTIDIEVSEGLSRRALDQFAVIGGKDVDSITVYPFMAGIYQVSGKNEMFLCGGTLLSKTVILTAAHCFLAKEASSQYRVKLGSVNFKTTGDNLSANEFSVISVIIHPEFKFPQLYNDIALLKIAGISAYTANKRPICLFNKAAEKKAPSTLTILGWGSQKAGGIPSTFLQEADIEIIPNSNCSSSLNKLGALTVSFPKGINNQILCAGNTQGTSKDACQGDSGGPAVVVIDGKWRQRGIVSSGVGCGVPGNPGIYTRVSEYETWIKENA